MIWQNVGQPQLIWRARLEPTPRFPLQTHVALDRTDRYLAWRADWESDAHVHVLDVRDGREISRVECSALDLLPTAGGFVALDHGREPPFKGPRNVVRIDAAGSAMTAASVAVGEQWQVIGADPTSPRLLVFHEGETELVSWPELEPLRGWSWRAPGVDWEAGICWGTEEGLRHQVTSLEGDLVGSVAAAWMGDRLAGVGAGLVRVGWHGIRLVGSSGRPFTVLTPTSRPIFHVRAEPDGQAVAAVLGGRPRRFHLDRAADQVASVPPDAGHQARGPSRRTPGSVAWHPSKTVLAVQDDLNLEIWNTDGTKAGRLRSCGFPKAWVAEDDSIITIATAPGAAWLERWAVGLEPGPDRASFDSQ